MAIICIQGGSYDPLTEAHLKGAHDAGVAAGANRNILLFSQNPLKDQHGKAPLADRLEMAAIRLSFHPEYDFELMTEESLGASHYTYDVLRALQERFPGDRLVWVMGSDNFASFMDWHSRDELLEHFSFVVLRRDSRPQDIAKEEVFKRTYAHLRRDSAAEALEKGGWYLMDNPVIPGRSTDFRADIKNGRAFSDPADAAVAAHARLRNLYPPDAPAFRPAPAPA